MTALPAAPRQAVKFARIVVNLQRREGMFLPWADTLPYRAEARAECARGGLHAPPAEDCSCGFYAQYSVPELMTLLQPAYEHVAASARLDVELGGVELAGPQGMRAAEQRVLGAVVMPCCALCDESSDPDDGRPLLYGQAHRWGDELVHLVLPLCAAHALLDDTLVPLTLAEVAGLLGTEVTWATDELALRLLGWRDALLADGQRRGPLLSGRRVGELRMGQVGFTTTDALRFEDGRLVVDGAAPALQREMGAAFVPVQRDVDLSLHVILTADNAVAVEQALCQPRLLPHGGKTSRVGRVRGLRHAPQMREVMAR